MQKISPDSAAQQMAGLDGWTLDSAAGVIRRDLTFTDFKAAWAFMTRVAAEADRMDHHPDWSNVYNRVSIGLTTHDAGGLTERDFAMARFIDRVAQAQAE